jgi:hypothetical protein
MHRKRAAQTPILVIVLAIPLLLSTLCVIYTETTSSSVNAHNAAILAQNSFTIKCPSDPITWYKDSKVDLIVWTITDTTADTITFNVLRNGTVEYSGIAERNSFLQGIPIFHSVPISEMDYGTYNYTLVATDGVEIQFASIILNLIEGTVTKTNLVLNVLTFLGITAGFTILYLAFLFGFSSLKRYHGGLKRIET